MSTPETTSRRQLRPGRHAAPRRRGRLLGARVGVATLAASTVATAALGAVAAHAYQTYVTSPPVLVQSNFNPQGDVGGQQLMAGGCAIRFSGTSYRPVKHYNDHHICANVSTVGINSRGQVIVRFARQAAIISLDVEEDETLSSRGILAGGSGGTNAAIISMYDTKLGRRLDLNSYSDRKRVGGITSNIWLSFLQVGPSPV